MPPSTPAEDPPSSREMPDPLLAPPAPFPAGDAARLLDAFLDIASDLDLASVLQRIVETAGTLVRARYAALGVIDEESGGLAEFVYTGIDPSVADGIGHLPEGRGILGLLIVDPRPLRLRNLHDHPQSYGFPPGHPPMDTFLGVPIRVRDRVFGNLYLCEKEGGAEFSKADERLAVSLAGAAGVAVENARLHARVAQLAVIEDRERIARDLHDTVIQRLFAVGMALQSTGRIIVRTDVAARVDEAVDELDAVIREIRGTIFALQSDRHGGLRRDLLAIADEACATLGFTPQLRFDGPVDTLVPAEIAGHLIPTLREALTNVARHAEASTVQVTVSVDDGVELRVVDDGRGVGGRLAGRTGHGISNLAQRAESLGGALSVVSPDTGGTLLTWRVPLGP